MTRFASVERLLTAAAGDVFPSAQLLVADRGAVLLEAAVGDATSDTIFDVASLTKALVTTTLVMRLVADGRMRLDDPLCARAPGEPPLLVRHALSHATGLPAWRPLHQLAAERQGRWDELRPAIVELARTTPLDAPPGARSVYSDLGFILLGDAVERALGERLDAAWEPLAGQLGVTATYHPDRTRCAPTSSAPERRGVVHDDNARAMGGIAPHAGLFATARAVSAVVASLWAAWSGAPSLLADGDRVRAFWTPSGVPGSTWCLGWDRPSPGASSAGSLWPRDGVGHLGFTGCSVWIDPPRGRWVVLLSNRVLPSEANQKIRALRPPLHDAIVRALDE